MITIDNKPGGLAARFSYMLKMSVCFTLTEQDEVKLRRSKINKLFIWGKRRHNPSLSENSVSDNPAATPTSADTAEQASNRRRTSAARHVAECPFLPAPPAGRVRPRPWEQQAIFWFVSLVSGASAALCNLRIMWITYVTLWEGLGRVVGEGAMDSPVLGTLSHS